MTKASGAAKSVTRAVGPEAVRDLLDDPPQATLAFVRDGAIEAIPVAFRLIGTRYVVGVPAEWAALAGQAKLLIDDGPWYYDLRGTWIRGSLTPCEPPASSTGHLAWFEIQPVKSVAWDYGAMRAK